MRWLNGIVSGNNLTERYRGIADSAQKAPASDPISPDIAALNLLEKRLVGGGNRMQDHCWYSC
jgi:hypothetical protein